jgi:hypothetical protein
MGKLQTYLPKRYEMKWKEEKKRKIVDFMSRETPKYLGDDIYY